MILLNRLIFTQTFLFLALILFISIGPTFNINQAELSPANLLIEHEEKESILKITFQGEIFMIPLQKAPFCRLRITLGCDCFILSRDQNTSDWDAGSFVNCDGKIYGEFMNGTSYFGIDPSNDSGTEKHLVTKFGLPDNFTEETIDFVDEVSEEESDHHYFKPLPEYYPLAQNETGYLKCFFIVDQRVLDHLKAIGSEIDIFLQILVNMANHYYFRFNILLIYCGWSLALPKHTADAKSVNAFFSSEEWALYDKKLEYHTLTLLTTTLLELENVTAVGQAYTNSMCIPHRNGIYVYYRKNRDNINIRNQLETFIHEIGHQFGLKHTSNTSCAGQEPKNVVWIMFSQTRRKPGVLEWSPCSEKKMLENRPRHSCLRLRANPYKPFCGDGLVEDEEECDCIVKECRQCCAADCRLKRGAKCSNGPCCDTHTCSYVKGIECRGARDMCDIPELCDGKSGQCPPNYVVANGYECKESPEGGYCSNGNCGSHQDVCDWIFTGGSVPGDECYNYNLEGGLESAGCGPVYPEKEPIGVKCAEKDKYCGKIWCNGNRSLLNPKFIIFVGRNIIRPARAGNCYLLMLAEGARITIDPTFVQDGSKCGDKKMCAQQACVPLPSGCPNDCPGEKIVHPYTQQVLPAFILGDPVILPSVESGTGSWTPIIWFIIITFIILLLISIILFMMNKYFPERLKSWNQNPFLMMKGRFLHKDSKVISNNETPKQNGATKHRNTEHRNTKQITSETKL